jgi:hypothetical protein
MVRMEHTMRTGKATTLLGVSVTTLQHWEREERLIPVARTDSNRRLSLETQIRECIRVRQAHHAPPTLVASCRVSRAAQQPDLVNQRNVLEAVVVAKGWAGGRGYRGRGRQAARHAQAVAGRDGRDRATGRHDADPRAPGPPHPFRRCVVRT